MASRQSILEYMNSLDDPSVDQAMAAALPSADEKTLMQLVQLLLERGQSRGLLGVILNYHRLPPRMQSAVVSRVDEFYSSLREASKRRATTSRSNVIDIVRRARNAKLTYLLADELRHGPPDLCDQSADALLELAKWAASDPDPEAEVYYDAQTAQYLQDAIVDALASFGHHQHDKSLLALVELTPRPIPKAFAILEDSRNAATSAARHLLETSHERAVLRSLLVMLQVPTLADSALQGLRQAVNNGELPTVLDEGHLMAIPKVSDPLQKLIAPETMLSKEWDMSIFKPHQSRALPRWISALHVTARAKVNSQCSLKHFPDAPTRMLALKNLIALQDDVVVEELAPRIAEFSVDPDPVIARIAVRHLVRSKWSKLTTHLLTLINSEHETVRALASRYVSPMGFDRLWSSWPRLSYGKQIAAGRALIKIDPDFHIQLGEKLARPDKQDQLRALSIIRTLNQGSFFEEALHALVSDEDEVMASAAVRALGAVNTSESVNKLEKALTHRDARVRANAVEALEQLQSTQHVGRLVEMAHNDENRPRANAIGSLMEMRMNDAFGALTEMLADERPMHRVSGLWLVEHMGLAEMARHVAEISISDADPNVKKRAANVIENLISALRGEGLNIDEEASPPEAPEKSVADKQAIKQND